MVVVSNTTPLNYLVLIDAVEVLPLLFTRVLTPQAVMSELLHGRTPELVRTWAATPPTWLDVQPGFDAEDPELSHLQAGERETIVLAQRTGANLVCIDESAGRAAATARGLRVAGTLGILDRAAERSWLDLGDKVERLRLTSFHMTDALVQPLLERDARRKRERMERAPEAQP
jgi:predicted nucleic acid-binding protein